MTVLLRRVLGRDTAREVAEERRAGYEEYIARTARSCRARRGRWEARREVPGSVDRSRRDDDAPDRRHVRDGGPDRPLVDREGLRDGVCEGRFAVPRLRTRQVHQPRGHGRLRGGLARRRDAHRAGEPESSAPTRSPRRSGRCTTRCSSRCTGCGSPSIPTTPSPSRSSGSSSRWCRRAWSTPSRAAAATACASTRTSSATTRRASRTGGSSIDGERTEFDSDSWVSTRDHSWGVRHGVGTPDPDTLPADRPSNLAIVVNWSPIVCERPDGSRYALHWFLQRQSVPGWQQRALPGRRGARRRESRAVRRRSSRSSRSTR